MDQPSHQHSMTVLMTPDTAKEIRTRNVRHVNNCFFTMVAVDDNRKPVAVKPWQPESDDERRRHAAAVLRKEMRQEMEKRFGELRVGG